MSFTYLKIYSLCTFFLVVLIGLFITAGKLYNNRQHYLGDIDDYHYLLDDALSYYDTCRFVDVPPFGNTPSYYCSIEPNHPVFRELTYSGTGFGIYFFIIHIKNNTLYYGDLLSHFGYPDNERLFHSRNGYTFQWNWFGTGGITVYSLNISRNRYNHHDEIMMIHIGREAFEKIVNDKTP